MKITKIELPAFRNFKGVTIPTDCPRVYICGANNTGKTGVREAIKWALTGRCDLTDQRGVGAEDLIPRGKREGSVAITLPPVGTIRRMINGSGSALDVDGFSGGLGVQQTGLYSKLQTTPEFLDAVLDWEVFTRLHHADAKALVLSLLQIRVPIQMDQKKDPELLSLEALDLRLERAVMERRDERNRLKAFRLPEVPDKAQPPVEKIREQLEKLRTEAGAIQQAIGAAVVERKRIQADMDRLPSLEEAEPQIDPALSPAIAALEVQLTEAEAATEPEPSPVSSDARETTHFYRNRAQALGSHDPKAGCVMDPGVPCKTPMGRFKEAAVEATDLASTIVEANKPLRIASPITRLRLEHTKKVELLRGQIAANEAFTVGVKRWRELARELNALPDTKEQEAALQTLNLRILKGDQLLLDALRYWDAVFNRNQALQQQKKIEEKVAALEYEVDYLGPKGARVQILDEKIKAFAAAINSVTQLWNLSVTFQVEPWEIQVNEMPFKTLSKSQRWRVAAAIQIAIASISGLGFIVIDEADMLDIPNIRALVQMVMTCTLDQVFILATRDVDDPLPSKVAGLLSHRLTINAKGDAQLAETVQG